MSVVLVVGIIVILVGVFYVAIGRGGELAYEQADHAPLDLGPVSATDVALLRPPTALWGYNMQVTDEALDRIARALRDRDILIASLQRQLGDAGRGEPAVTAIEAESLLGATGLTQAARWDEVITAKYEAATALDEAAAALGEAATALDDAPADTDAIDTGAPATVELATTDAAETTGIVGAYGATETAEAAEGVAAPETSKTAAPDEQPRRFVPKHERPRKARRTGTPPAATANAAEPAEAAAAAETAEATAPAEDGESTAAEQPPPDKPEDDAEEQGW